MQPAPVLSLLSMQLAFHNGTRILLFLLLSCTFNWGPGFANFVLLKIMSSISDGSSDCHCTHIHRVALFFDPLSCIGSRAFYNITSNCNSKGHCQGRHWAITSQLLWNQWSLLCMISSSLVQRFFFWALFAFWKWVSTIMDFGYSLFLINKKRLHKGLACCSKEVCLILFVMIFGFETGGGSGQPATSRP